MLKLSKFELPYIQSRVYRYEIWSLLDFLVVLLYRQYNEEITWIITHCSLRNQSWRYLYHENIIDCSRYWKKIAWMSNLRFKFLGLPQTFSTCWVMLSKLGQEIEPNLYCPNQQVRIYSGAVAHFKFQIYYFF